MHLGEERQCGIKFLSKATTRRRRVENYGPFEVTSTMAPGLQSTKLGIGKNPELNSCLVSSRRSRTVLKCGAK